MAIEYPMPTEFIGSVEEGVTALRTIRKIINSIDAISMDIDAQAQIEKAFRPIDKTLTVAGFYFSEPPIYQEGQK